MRRSRISDVKFREILKYFSLDIEANKAAVVASLNRNTINRYYLLIRKRISRFCEAEGRRLGFITEKHDGCEATNATMFFGICLINHKIYTEIVNHDEFIKDCKGVTSQKQLDRFLSACDSSHRDDYLAVVNYHCDHYMRRNFHSVNRNLTGDLKACDLFWRYTKSRLMKFKGISKSTLCYHIKECEFRFNHRYENLYKLLLQIMR
jgi:transposase-like protein